MKTTLAIALVAIVAAATYFATADRPQGELHAAAAAKAAALTETAQLWNP